MDAATRRALAGQTLGGYAHGPDAPLRATARALAKVGAAAALILVEGVSDQVAVETAAAARGRDLDADGVVVVPIGGAHAIGRFLGTLGPAGTALRLAGLCDLREAELFRRGLAGAHRATVHVCVEDLEDELIRALGVAAVEALCDTQGDLTSLRSLQRQPAWRDQPPDAQLRRFLGSGARRKQRYARLLVDAAAVHGTVPAPLDALLTAV
ncbi:TOPRIM nucleotidyl transferase/hydrolase domain-containing protein [Dactylosporangium aurantiacum]|uniref:TOPRIM nucleotidyl transferase/hydrolase domain-containing protein n=1 Tax=Dactylosporangium aurantiacum TaxID=35754 RepID=UPI0007C4F2B9|nr:TOPRIM nucleotidyl transferase/hydrolase domain-containing protein [Dactylosporangium aurantiacum]MDG6103771.1 ATP-dependent endonuclease [Dactylosporangium aurantiacum]